jgi:pimeloyl-ACP methyl ester carboxylesterase
MPALKSQCLFAFLSYFFLTINLAVGATPAASMYSFDRTSFNSTFHHGVAVVDGVKLHYVEGGEGNKGAPILLVPGWPESWFAWRLVMPALVATGHHVVAIDLRGMGDSDHPIGGYDSKTIARDIHGFVKALDLTREGPINVAAHDVGAWMAYAYTVDWPQDVGRLTLMEAALPGITPAPPAGIPNDIANMRTWHFGFNRLPDLPEELVQGHERVYLNWLFTQKSAKAWVFTPDVLDEYVRVFSQPGGARSAFSYYRAVFSDSGLQQNRDRAQIRLTIPVLTIGGQYGVGDMLQNTMQLVASDVHGIQLPECGHFVLEECPAEVTGKLLDFFK